MSKSSFCKKNAKAFLLKWCKMTCCFKIFFTLFHYSKFVINSSSLFDK